MNGGTRGFNAVDLLMACAVLGTLGALAVPAYRNADAQSKYLGTKSMLVGVQTVIMGRREVDHQTLIGLTQSTCTFCDQGMVPARPLQNVTPKWSPAIAAQWEVMGYAQQPFDLWHQPLLADQNELEFGPTDCRHDVLYSAGANGLFEGASYDNSSPGPHGDDIAVTVPWFSQTVANCPAEGARAAL